MSWKKHWMLHLCTGIVLCLLLVCLFLSFRLASSAVSSPECSEDLGLLLQESDHGLTVLAVEHGSDAGRSGLQPGDTLLSVNHERITSLEDLDAIIQLQNGGQMIFRMMRHDQPVELSVSLQ